MWPQRLCAAVALDEPSVESLSFAGHLATRLGLPLEIVHVSTGDATPEELQGLVHDTLGDVKVKLHLRSHTSIAEGIIAATSELGADLLVVGSHAHGVIRRALLGSIAEKVLRLATMPTILVPPHDRGLHAGHAPSVQQVVAATDFSPEAERAVQVAATLTRAFGGKLTIVHAGDEGRERLEELRERYEHDDHRIGIVDLPGRSPGNEVLTLVEGTGADLLAIGLRGLGGARRFFGTVAETIVRGSTVPVLTAR
jgi:nucleotide-binding universal stress UspA family protein